MDVEKRIRAVRIIEKMGKHTGYCEKLGIKNASVFYECGKVKHKR